MAHSIARIALVFLIFIILNSCKKIEDPDTKSPSNHPVGFFSLWKSYDATSTPLYILNANFCPVDPELMEYRGPNIEVDSLLANGRKLQPDSYNIYGLVGSDSAFSNSIVTWKLYGKNGFPTFSRIDSIQFPDFEFSIPTEIDKKAGLTVSLVNAQHSASDSAWIHFFADSVNQGLDVGRSGWTATLTSKEISRMNSNEEIQVYARTRRKETVLVDGVIFRYYRFVDRSARVRVK